MGLIKKIIHYLFDDQFSSMSKRIDEIVLEINNTRMAIDNTNSLMEKTITNMEDIPIDYSYIDDAHQDLGSVYDSYIHRLHKQSRGSLLSMTKDVIGSITLYDKMLYKASDIIFKSSTALLTHITLLDELRDTIFRFMFDVDNDPEFNPRNYDNFYLFYTSCQKFDTTLKSIPIIDKSKMFMVLDYKHKNNILDGYYCPMSDDDMPYVNKEKYIILDYRKTGTISIISPTGVTHFDSRYSKSVLRVFYSIYMHKMYLYRLFETNYLN